MSNYNQNRNYNNMFNNNHVNENEQQKVETPVVETENNEEPKVETPVVETENNEEPNEESEEENEESEEETEEENEESENNEEEMEEESEGDNEDEEPKQTKNVQYAKVEVPSLNIRKKPTKESEIVAVVKKDQKLELRESTSVDGFYAVKTENGIDGYCMDAFISLV